LIRSIIALRRSSTDPGRITLPLSFSSSTNGSSSALAGVLGSEVRPGEGSSLAKSPPGVTVEGPRWGRGRMGIGGMLDRLEPDVEGVGRRLGSGAYVSAHSGVGKESTHLVAPMKVHPAVQPLSE
jgi:hypothetical protein